LKITIHSKRSINSTQKMQQAFTTLRRGAHHCASPVQRNVNAPSNLLVRGHRVRAAAVATQKGTLQFKKYQGLGNDFILVRGFDD
jgi:hypothetical protein